MNLLPSFSIWQFAVAGAIFATGPLIIHLLNRRRFRVVHWAAMEFLLQAVKRNRRILQLRDLILLLLRTAAVLLFGLAMFSLPIKMYLRWMFNLKYIIAIPEWFFNI